MNNISEDDLERLDELINNSITGDARDQLTKKMQADPNLRAAYDQLLAVREVSRRRFHHKQKEIFRSLENRDGKRTLIRPMWLAVAAVGALVITALLWLMPDSSTSQSLLAEYRKFPNVVLPIEKSGDNFSPREKAYQAYELSAYSQAITRFNTLPELNADDSLYLALSFYESSETDNAQRLFDSLQHSSTNDRAAQVSQWYLMWLDVRTGDLGSARARLSQIAGTDRHRYQQEATKLLGNF